MYHGVGLLFLTAIGGYWVLERAETHKGQLRQVGRVLGTVIIVASLMGAVCRVWCLAAGAMRSSTRWRGTVLVKSSHLPSSPS